MGATDSSQSALVIASLLGLALSAGIYGRLLQGLRRDGGQVDVSHFGRADYGVGLALAAFFAGLVALSANVADPVLKMTVGKLLASSGTFGSIVFALGAWLHFRGFHLPETFGFRRLGAPRVLGTAALFVVGAFPLIALASTLLQQWMKEDAAEQELVQLFRDAAGQGDSAMMLAVFFAGVIVAPICEEVLFRGYFYAVGKRFAGPWVSAVATSAVFAVFHGNLVSLPGLLALALLLTAAYERTGSLAVPITMHALFNGTSLTILYLQATGRLDA